MIGKKIIKTLITATVIALTSTSVMAHDATFEKNDAYHFSYCFNIHLEGEYDNYSTVSNAKEYVGDLLENKEGWKEGRKDAIGKSLFGGLTKAEARTCLDDMLAMAKKQYDLHN